ncbi:hypothetical protein GCM10010869_73120 [Mesorhizobium tianshanense]|nr:hypothetical protein GCM10010869_73120 [Mesorhizobium tianshanense]
MIGKRGANQLLADLGQHHRGGDRHIERHGSRHGAQVGEPHAHCDRTAAKRLRAQACGDPIGKVQQRGFDDASDGRLSSQCRLRAGGARTMVGSNLAGISIPGQV